MKSCRLIIEVPETIGGETGSLAKPGALNMAIDEALLRSAAETGDTTLRFYAWEPTLSLGYFQHYEEREQHSPSLDCNCVRRSSGGGAILHHHELTYSFATPEGKRFGHAQHYYLAFHETLVELLHELGVADTRLYPAEDGLTDEAFLCFQRRAENDIVCGDYKICGSAQRRWKQGLLQHGSLLFEKSPYAPELPGLKELASFHTPAKQFVTSWLLKLSSRLNVEFAVGNLTDKEIEHSEGIRREKFSAEAWNRRR